MKQGSPEWFEARKGKITASRFSVLLYGTVDAWNTYIEELRFGWKQEFTSDSVQWGERYESEARACYELCHATDFVEECGFILHPKYPNVGGSPDGLVGEDGLVEIKCPYNPAVHEATLRHGVPAEHIPQIQGNLWVTGRKWCDFISYDPRQSGLSRRCFVQRVTRCPNVERKIEERVALFRSILAEGRYASVSDFQINPVEDEIPNLF